MNAIKTVRTAALLTSCVLGTAFNAVAQTPPVMNVTGKIAWAAEGKPALDFAPQTALGLYVKASSNYMLAFFADPLTPQEANYWLARQAMVLGGKFGGQKFQPDPAMNARVNALQARSASLWGVLKEQSKFAKGGVLPADLAAEHLAKDLIGVMLCVGHNCSYRSSGVHTEQYAAQVTALRIPTPAAALSGQTAMLDVTIKEADAGSIVLKGELPFYVVPE